MNGKWNIKRFTPDLKKQWNDLVSESRNGTFLFLRDYMDYHSDRFKDFSLLACNNDRVMALLPANICGKELHSHQGLTYGGWILPKRHLDGADFMDLWQVWLRYCHDKGIERIYYKPVPYIYHSAPSQEDLYALFRSRAINTETNLSSTIDLRSFPGFNNLMRRHLRKASETNTRICEVSETDEFHRMTEQCLSDRHGTTPVHTASELQKLKKIFPDNIRFFMAYTASEPVAGVCIYTEKNIAHCQYISSSEKGRKLNILPLLFHYLITEIFQNLRYFDFGTSNENAGMILNKGLLRQKFSFGGTGVAYSKYLIDLM